MTKLKIFKSNAHLQAINKTHAMFQKVRNKIVAVLTKYPLVVHVSELPNYDLYPYSTQATNPPNHQESINFRIRLDSWRIVKFSIVGHPEHEKKHLLAFLSTFWHPC